MHAIPPPLLYGSGSKGSNKDLRSKKPPLCSYVYDI
jgi:hypothetical protein